MSELPTEVFKEIKLLLEMTADEAIKGDMAAGLLSIVYSDISQLVAGMILDYESKTITKMDMLKFTKIALDTISKRIATQVATLSSIAKH